MIIAPLGIVLLLVFGAMFNGGAISFQIYALEQGWDPQQKAKACFTAAVIYAGALALSVVYNIYSSKKALQQKL